MTTTISHPKLCVLVQYPAWQWVRVLLEVARNGRREILPIREVEIDGLPMTPAHMSFSSELS